VVLQTAGLSDGQHALDKQAAVTDQGVLPPGSQGYLNTILFFCGPKRSRVRPMIDSVVATNEKLRIPVRSLSVLLRSGATGFDTALATSGSPSSLIAVWWPSTGSSTRALPNSAKTDRQNQIYQVVPRNFCLPILKRQPELSEVRQGSRRRRNQSAW
jgi:hypothetical protein